MLPPVLGRHGEPVSSGAEPAPAPEQLAASAEMPSCGRSRLSGAVENALAGLHDCQVGRDHAGEPPRRTRRAAGRSRGCGPAAWRAVRSPRRRRRAQRGSAAGKTHSMTPKVRKSNTELNGPKKIMKRRMKPMSQCEGLRSCSSSTLSVGDGQLAGVVEQVVEQDLAGQERQEQRRASGGEHAAEVAGRPHQHVLDGVGEDAASFSDAIGEHVEINGRIVSGHDLDRDARRGESPQRRGGVFSAGRGRPARRPGAGRARPQQPAPVPWPPGGRARCEDTAFGPHRAWRSATSALDRPESAVTPNCCSTSAPGSPPAA
jgi:hypothetical protein